MKRRVTVPARPRHPLHEIGRRAVGLQGVAHEAAGEVSHAERLMMEAQDDRVASLDRDQHLEDGGGDRVGHRRDREHDADRAGDLGHAPLGVHGQHPLGDLSGQRVVDAEAREPDLQRLVGHVPEPGLADRGDRQFFSSSGQHRRDVRQQGVDPLVGPVLEGGLRAARAVHHHVDVLVELRIGGGDGRGKSNHVSSIYEALAVR